MRFLAAIFVASLLPSGAMAADQPSEIVTAAGRKSKLTRRYDLAEVRKLIEHAKPREPFNVSHPIAPTVEDLKKLEAELKKSGVLWYFVGLDSGWVVMRDQKPVLVVVVSHEY